MNGPNNSIGWCDWTWNPVKGLCPVACSYCYARKIYNRFHYNPAIGLDREELVAPYKRKKATKIFVGSTIELFGDMIHPWMPDIIKVAQDNPRHTFQFLTTVPLAMADYTFPDNCWRGVSVQTPNNICRIYQLKNVSVKTKFISFEPLHDDFFFDHDDFRLINWIIIGAETGNRKGRVKPRKEWIASILNAADTWDLPVYMKDNLKPYWFGELRKEFPKKK